LQDLDKQRIKDRLAEKVFNTPKSAQVKALGFL